MSNLSFYNEFHSTDNLWLPQLPIGWYMDRFNDLIDLKHGFQFRDFDFTDEGIKVVKITQLSSEGFLVLDNCSFIDNLRLNDFKKIIIKKGDVLMALTGGTIGKIIKVSEVNEPLLQNYRVGSFIPNKRKLDKTYMFYFLSSVTLFDQINYYINRNGQPNVGKENFKYMFIAFPPFTEQTTIATYLDTKTQAIEKKIHLLTTKIEYYKELRKTIINNAIYQGIPNSKSKPKLKNSDVSYVNQLNANWNLVRVKDLFIIGRGRVIGQDLLVDNGKYPVYSSQTENNGCLGYIETYDFNADMLTWTTDGANAGTVFRRSGKFNCTNVCGTLLPIRKNLDLNYMVYALQESAKHNKRIDTNGAKIMNNEMAVIQIPFPTKPEQTEIANYLDVKISTIDKITTNLQTQIETLKELRKTLINDVVTGKVKVK